MEIALNDVKAPKLPSPTSMLVSGSVMILTVYMVAWLTTPSLSIGVALIVLAHECGHAYALLRCGYRVKHLFIIMPILGFVQSEPKELLTWDDEYWVRLAGPASILIVGPVIWVWAWVTHDPTLWMLLYLAALINILNLLPVAPLDGGFIAFSFPSFRFNWTIRLPFVVFSILLIFLVAPIFAGFMLLFGIATVVGAPEKLVNWPENSPQKTPVSVVILICIFFILTALKGNHLPMDAALDELVWGYQRYNFN